MIEGVSLTPLRIIPGEYGEVLHAMKCTDSTFAGFGEAYFSTIKKGAVKAWKRHRKMILNLVVPCGEIKFVLYDDRQDSSTCGKISEIILSRSNYQRLTVPSMIWMGFKGQGNGLNMLLNVSNIPHDPDEVDRQDGFENNICYDWEKDHI
ncbi:MAG: dTDP-4-dehydrorhamnose 3,5-epimerase family protein [Candidatus Methanoperedens sp.]|nr:dTDP-4-dehydrorhamnose 3,5-epimerase family protein [Candidatus Methanoperedens sp.]CAG0969536.1 dTDP-4-dehydrorhamnose 3,5-epimerase [Methanosarcinales archaeon]